MNALSDVFRGIGEHVSQALDEALANAVDDVEIFALRRPVAQIAALELIGFVRRELLDRESELAVVLKRLDEIGRERLGDEGGQVRPSAPTPHPETRWPCGTRSRLRVPANADVGELLQEPDDFSWNHDGQG